MMMMMMMQWQKGNYFPLKNISFTYISSWRTYNRSGDIRNFRLIIRRHYATIIVSARYDDDDDDPKPNPSSTTIQLAVIHDKHQHPQNTVNRVIYYKIQQTYTIINN